jgi:hypothetical protein
MADTVPPIGRILKALAALAAGLLYVWVAAVRAVPRIRRRKRLRGVGSRARRAAARAPERR